MRTTKEPEVRKQEILEGAIKVFAKKGYDKTTTSDIANELNISQGLCYRYFPTKEAIYDAALEKYADVIAEEMLCKVNFAMPIKELIERFTEHGDDLRTIEKEDEGLYTLFHSENSGRMHDELFLKVAKKVTPHIQKYLQKAKKDQEINIKDTDTVAVIGIYGWIGLRLTKGLTDKECMEKMRLIWYKLLEL